MFLASLGFDVFAVDFSKEATNNLLKKSKKKGLSLNIIQEDFFKLSKFYSTFDILLEYTFFCAILPSKRCDYIKEVHKLLKENGEYVGFLLPINKDINESGPPFGINMNDTMNKFSKYFTIIECNKSKLSIEF